MQCLFEVLLIVHTEILDNFYPQANIWLGAAKRGLQPFAQCTSRLSRLNFETDDTYVSSSILHNFRETGLPALHIHRYIHTNIFTG